MGQIVVGVPRKLVRADPRMFSGALRLARLLALVATCAINLPGCMAHLAPDYDPAVVDGLTNANLP
jgi:hypothetical protein